MRLQPRRNQRGVALRERQDPYRRQLRERLVDFWNFASFQAEQGDPSPWFWFFGPGPPQIIDVPQIQGDMTQDKKKADRPTVLAAKSWCPSLKGASVGYWLLRSDGGRSAEGWVVVEHVDPRLANSEYGPGTSSTAGPPDGFDDDIGDMNGGTFDTGQTLTITAGLGKQHYGVVIKWIDRSLRGGNDIKIVNGHYITINGVPTGSSCHYPQ